MKTFKLGELRKGQKGKIVAVRSEGTAEEVDLGKRLLEMGLIEGSVVEVLHEAPLGGDPIAVRVRGALLALRRQEANQVEVSEVSS